MTPARARTGFFPCRIMALAARESPILGGRGERGPLFRASLYEAKAFLFHPHSLPKLLFGARAGLFHFVMKGASFDFYGCVKKKTCELLPTKKRAKKRGRVVD